MSRTESDGGIKSRKMWFAAGTSMLVLVGAVLAAKYPAFSANYEVFVGGQLGTLAIYSGSNVGAKYIVRRQKTKPESADD
jgi:hypothetical protein